MEIAIDGRSLGYSLSRGDDKVSPDHMAQAHTGCSNRLVVIATILAHRALSLL
jgi:hypothetical protein